VRDRFFGFDLGENRSREGKMRAIIVCRHRERVRPQGIGVAPERCLMISASAERNDDDGGYKRTVSSPISHTMAMVIPMSGK
jgi:hypothetical protein